MLGTSRPAERRIKTGICGWADKRVWFVVVLICLFWLKPAWAETLADIDAEIQTDKTLIRVSGQDAYNVYAGVTNDRLNRKIAILNSSGITNFASVGKYSNFYSFTGTSGVTDTTIDLITTTSTVRLYRRSNSLSREVMGAGYLGSWWSGSYLGVNDTRNKQAVLAAWGSDLQRIYVIDVPAGITLVGGIASPMEKNGEYRYGGAYQYYYRGALRNWVVYALSAPDYLESYAASATGAQKAARLSLEDIGDYLADERQRTLPKSSERLYQPNGGEGGWFRIYGGTLRYGSDGAAFNLDFHGLHGGWDMLARNENKDKTDQLRVGALIGCGSLDQTDGASNVKNAIKNTYAGVYTQYQSDPAGRQSWYGNAVAMLGRLEFNNQVPGEAGYGLNQSYAGHILAFSLENGMTLRRAKGWIVEPQLQLLYTKLYQDNFQDSLGARVELRSNDSLLGRLGVMALRSIRNQAGRQTRFWLKASAFHEFCGANSLDVAGDMALSNPGRNFVQLGGGLEHELDTNIKISANWTQSFGDERGYRWSLLMMKHW